MSPNSGYAALALAIGLSVGECHNAVRRLGLASLLVPAERRPVGELLLRFLVHGVPYAFPPVVGPLSIGVLTAHAAPVFEGQIDSEQGFVWPHADGEAHGFSLTPLFSRAPELPRRNRALYDLLALIDALRVGHARERKVAEPLLRARLMREPG